jgi:hypothetical protein
MHDVPGSLYREGSAKNDTTLVMRGATHRWKYRAYTMIRPCDLRTQLEGEDSLQYEGIHGETHCTCGECRQTLRVMFLRTRQADVQWHTTCGAGHLDVPQPSIAWGLDSSADGSTTRVASGHVDSK